jgi:ribonuclease P protein subunit RPR2
VGLGVWLALGVLVALAFGRAATLIDRSVSKSLEAAPVRAAGALAQHADSARRRILLVDDDPHLRILLRTTLTADEYSLEEAGSAAEARQLARFWRPELVVLDLGLPDASGLVLCEELTSNPAYAGTRVVLLTGSDVRQTEAEAAGASALLRKPYSPLDVIGTIDRVLEGRELPSSTAEPASDQLLAYAEDLGHVVQSERAQRRLLQQAYRQTVASLTDALEAKNQATGKHALRVHLYALDLTEAVAPGLLDDTSLEYGFLLHDIGKIGIPDALLEKEGPLDPHELRVMRQHPLIGVQLLSEVPLLSGEGLRVVRSHHERWDGHGYPDGLAGKQIPPGARIFAVADALDAMTSDRPYRKPLEWNQAVSEIVQQSGSQFDPQVVGALARRESRLRRTRHDVAIGA